MPDRSPATRGAPRGSVPKSTLFSIFIRCPDGDTVRFVDGLNCLHWQTAKLPCRGSFLYLRSGPADTPWCSTRKHDLFQAGKHLTEEPSWLKGVGDYRGHKARSVRFGKGPVKHCWDHQRPGATWEGLGKLSLFNLIKGGLRAAGTGWLYRRVKLVFLVLKAVGVDTCWGLDRTWSGGQGNPDTGCPRACGTSAPEGGSRFSCSVAGFIHYWSQPHF